MSGFKALNVDSESEEEVDDTKEIQIEEASKVYQNALRLHASGGVHYAAAKEAYDELFQSELFKYPEALSEFAHDQLDETTAPTILPTEIEPVVALPSNAADSSANSIPQLVYLAHKNRGHFALDNAHYDLPADISANPSALRRYYSEACKSGLGDFAEALERDDTDIDLWKRAARVADVLSTPRIGRFCLESVLAGDDDGEQTVDISGLDEAFAAGELKDVISLLQDDLSQISAAGVQPKPLLLKLLRNTNDAFPFLPRRVTDLQTTSQGQHSDTVISRSHTLHSDNIIGVGNELLQLILKHQDGEHTVAASDYISLRRTSSHSPAEMEQDDFVDAAEEMSDTSSSKDVKEGTAGDANAPESVEMTDRPNVEVETEVLPQSPKIEEPANASMVELPTRKRSSAAAGNEEPEGRIKSKRLRARESMFENAIPDEEVVPEAPSHQQWNWTVLKNADSDMLKTVDMFLGRLNLPQYGTAADIQANTDGISTDDEDGGVSCRRRLAADLSNALKVWTDEHSQAILHGHGSQDFIEKSAGLTLFMQHLKGPEELELANQQQDGSDDMSVFAEMLEEQKTILYDAAFLWLSSLLVGPRKGHTSSSYLRKAWPADLKQLVVQVLIRVDEFAYERLTQLSRVLSGPKSADTGELQHMQDEVARLSELVLAIFELHVDIHTRITNPSSQVQNSTRVEQTDRLGRWAKLTDSVMQLHAQDGQDLGPTNDMVIRFMWATTTFAGKAEDVDQAHIMRCLQDLKRILQENDTKPITLPNNAATPIISAAAAEQELFRLSTLDFFLSVFDSDNDDPVAVIEKLEPVLEADVSPGEVDAESEAGKLIDFLNSGDAALRLFLWRRLQNAYTTISYTPKVVSCLLRSIEIIVRELLRLSEVEADDEQRQVTMLKWLKDADELIAKVLSKVLDDSAALEVVDEDHLRSSLTTVTFLLRLLHIHALFEDNVRFGYAAGPQFKGNAGTRLYERSKDRLREMQVHLWALQYVLLKEAIKQNRDLFPDGDNDLADYLCTTHFALGQRSYCRYANKQFVRLVKSELSTLETTNNYLGDMAQVMFDLYGLRFKISEGDFEHGCTTENLDKKTATSLIPMVMTYALQVSMKDLLKSELRNTIDKVHTTSGSTKSGPEVLKNRKLMSTYLKSQLMPNDFYKAYKGQAGLEIPPVEERDSIKAKSGWYFLLGHITLAKYRAVKRTTPTPTDDLDQAASLLRQDLEYNQEKWETWWRLAQIYEAKIEDDLIWNSSKLNDARSDIALLERHSIHAYLMAMTMAMRTAGDDHNTAQKIQDMFREFAIRLYSSSRPPLDMEAFKTDKTTRFLSNPADNQMSEAPLHVPWTPYLLWRFAAKLLQKTFIEDKPKPWTTHYYRHKCLWKIFQAPENARARQPVTADDVASSLGDAIQALPRTQKSSEIILEPHIRLVSLMHKMVRMSALSPQEGFAALQVSRFSQGIALAEDEDGPDWERYLLDVLKKLSAADKSNWQHRIINRAAHVIYDCERNMAGALGAKHEFTQQIFTKTMTYQVWKPEFERPGRHYVYTGQYVTFFCHLLDQLQDRANLDQLIRRVRRKYTDFINHTAIWEHLATTYVQLLRRIGKVPAEKERAVFDHTSFEEFSRLSEKVEAWALDADTSSVVLDIMRDAIELKKLNNSLLKSGVIDDLIGDAYAVLYDAYVSQLSPEERAPPPPPAPAPGSFINTSLSTDGEPATSNHPLGLAIQTPATGVPANNDTTQPAKAPQRAVPPNKPGRAKTITRREVQRKAEAAIAKPPPIKTPTLSKRPIIEIPMSTNGHRTGSPASGDHEGAMDSRATSRRNSIQGSVDDENDNDNGDGEAGNDADDESELSEIDEDEDGEGEETIKVKTGRPLFPGLLGNRGHGQVDGSDADDEEMEEYDGDGQEEEGGDGEGQGDDGGGDDGAGEGNGEVHKPAADAMAVDKQADAAQVEIPDSQDKV